MGGGDRRSHNRRNHTNGPSSLPAKPPSGPRNDRRDSYRPSQGDFTFNSQPPSGPANFRDRAGGSENGAPRYDRDRRRPRDSGRLGRGGRLSFGAGSRNGRSPWQRFNAAERPMLTLDSSEPVISLRDGKDGTRYKSLDEITDDLEQEMELSDGEGNASNREHWAKRIKTSADNAPTMTDNEKKDETEGANQGKETEDKAESQSVEPTSTTTVTVSAIATTTITATAAPVTPRWSNANPYTAIAPEDHHSSNRTKELLMMIRKGLNEDHKSMPAADLDEMIFVNDSDNEEEIIEVASSPQSQTWTNISASTTPTKDFGSRKRTADDFLKPMPKSKQRAARGMQTLNMHYGEWAMAPGQRVTTPWIQEYDNKKEAIARLSEEVRDFYHYVEPRDFEESVRQDLIDRLKMAIKRNYSMADCEVACFGSFMSGLYLPTADMDLVIVSRRHYNGGAPTRRSKSFMYKFKTFLMNNQLCQPNSIQMIIGAKVPLVKYVDHQTNLKVDVSFENMSGVDAISTFKSWKKDYPIMPKLVTLIKNFMAIRALNEPVNGGIGGFSVCCLVVSMLQLDPAVRGLSARGDEDIGKFLMEFFNLYGNNFDYATTAIQMNPPAYVPKTHVQSLIYKNLERLSIIDPNNVANDISGGSSRFPEVAACFAAAYTAMIERFESADDGLKNYKSLLEPILGANYSHFDNQRTILENAFHKLGAPRSGRPGVDSGNGNAYNGSPHGLPSRPPSRPSTSFRKHPPPADHMARPVGPRGWNGSGRQNRDNRRGGHH